MRYHKNHILILSTFAVLGWVSVVSADINIQLETVASPVQVGDTVEVRLNIAGTPGNQNVGFVQTILTWDPAKLMLTGTSQAGAFAWTSANFYNDGDGINAGYPPVPNNDGNAVFRARANTATSVPPAGIRVTTFQFVAIDTVTNSPISVVSSLLNTSTVVLNADVPFGSNVNISTITNSTVTVTCSSSPQCNDQNPCTDDSCVATQCQYVNDNTNNPDDGLRCNGVEQSCSGGAIIYVPGMGPIDCSSLNSTCSVGVCNEPSGSCSANPINEGAICNDNLFCTISSHCASGSCVGSGNPCPQLCNEATDECVTCISNSDCSDDGQFCTSPQECVMGDCVAGPDPCPPPNDICLEASDMCVQCTTSADCSDGNFCNGVETCVGNVCQAGVAPCAPGDVCCETTDFCAPDCCTDAQCADIYPCSSDICGVAGECVHFANATPCQNASFCDGAERCVENPPGVFACLPPSGPACAIGDVCCEATDVCTPDCCVDADCVDVNYCNGIETCLNGVCQPGVAVDCSSLTNECRVGVCDEMTDSCSTQNINQNGSCNDDNTCTYADKCVNGVCDGCLQGEVGCTPQGCVNLSWDPPSQIALVGSTVQVKLIAKSCNATAQAVDAVDVILGWNATRLQLATSTGGNPNPQDPCTPASCPPSPPYTVYDWLSSGWGNDCALDAINSPCSGTPANDGDSFYTALSQIPPNPTAMATAAGIHVTTFKFLVLPGPSGATTLSFTPCFAPDGSTVTRVVGGSGAGTVVTGTLGGPATINIQQCANNAQCNDGLDCNGNETCVSNSCVPGTPLCDPSGPTPVCIEASNTCVACTQNSHCSDGLFCNGTETCMSNICNAAANPACTAPLMCDESQDQCVECFTNIECDDGVACTDDQCILGDCFNVGNDSLCQDTLFCNGAEVCIPGQGCMSPGNPCCDPLACNEPLDTCGGGCQAANVLAIGSRWISVTPADGPDPVALLVSGDPNDPQISCLSQYVQADGTLGVNPVFQTPAVWGTVLVHDSEIRPQKMYTVCTSCASGFSAKSPVTLWRYGDGNNNGVITLDDILCELNGFAGSFGTPPSFCTLYSTDLIGPGCIPNALINLDDILQVLSAFQGALVVPPQLCPAVCP